MTYKDQVNAALERTLALPTTPAWAPPVLRSIASFTIGVREIYQLIHDMNLLVWALMDLPIPVIERMVRENDLPEWMRGALESAIQDGDSVWDVTRRHTLRDVKVLFAALMRRTENVFNASILANPYEDIGEEQAVANIQEALGVLRGATPPGTDWGIEPLEEGISDGADWYRLYQILVDLTLLAILMETKDDEYLGLWVDSNIPQWMRTALVHFRIAQDQWSRGRQIADTELVEKLLGALWASKTNELQEGGQT